MKMLTAVPPKINFDCPNFAAGHEIRGRKISTVGFLNQSAPKEPDKFRQSKIFNIF